MAKKIDKPKKKVLQPYELKTGDILCHHGTSQQDWSTKSEHTAIVGGVTTDNLGLYIYDAHTSKHLRQQYSTGYMGKCAVFRLRDFEECRDLPTLAGQWAKKMYDQQGGDKVVYGGNRAAAGWIRSKFGANKFGNSSDKRLEKYMERGAPHKVFCSEYAILCYQLACKEKGIHRGGHFFPNVDARYTMPWDLEAYLLEHIGWWEFIGCIGVSKVD